MSKTKRKIRSSERTKYVNLHNLPESPGLSRNLGIFVCWDRADADAAQKCWGGGAAPPDGAQSRSEPPARLSPLRDPHSSGIYYLSWSHIHDWSWAAVRPAKNYSTSISTYTLTFIYILCILYTCEYCREKETREKLPESWKVGRQSNARFGWPMITAHMEFEWSPDFSCDEIFNGFVSSRTPQERILSELCWGVVIVGTSRYSKYFFHTIHWNPQRL